MTFRLHDFAIDLTARARAGLLDPVLGRDREIERLLRILARKTKNNPVLLGEPGVGKTAIVEGLAQRIVSVAPPSHLAEVTVYALNLGSVLAGTSYRGDFEQRLQQLIAELRRPGSRRLLFVDELHLLGRAGRSEGGLDAGNLLKPLLARGELPCIGASTPDEWQQLVALDPALERRFQPVTVAEASPAQTLQILRGLRARYEGHHGVEITEDALHAAIDHAVARDRTRRLPDKAIDLLDEACAMVRLARGLDATPEWTLAERALSAAAEAFDLSAYAHLRSRVIPALRPTSRPQVDAAAIARLARNDE
ncbi:AAA family ATPase [Opitutus sp. ER46]|uniref:AAA family ATPase n=1 Tax=Opitutus sp. ER46 TaxID=2161864 RepID=UPI000D31D0F0|nr:AAA family ATPase [Opitutus sp. ER46]PTX98487.1 hypothetical protein DB354_04250 [Opitutus sp. ER46]